jgi:hypothetical protein
MSENKSIDAILSQYEQNTKKSGGSKPKISNEDRLKKYFTEKLQKGQNEATKTFRILPGKDGASPFVEAYFHEPNVGGKWEKVYCPKLNDGEHCAICEAREALLLDGSEKGKKMANEKNARLWYVVKGIDRDNEDHGVKFWRYKHKYNGEGVHDKLIPLFKKKGDLSDPREGRDIEIQAGRNDKKHSIVKSIMYEDVSILTEDKEKANEWFNNEETFRDVYSKKPAEWMDIVAIDKTPVWDSELKKYVAEEDKEDTEKASLEEEINLMRDESTENSTEIIASAEEDSNEEPFSTDLESADDELPF